jgi:acyl-CoA reductase-like NAD-dependent aldehyde dehydrogenase
MIAVTGGHGVVAFATSTGKRVIAGGPGNPPVVVDETSDLDRAAKCIMQGAAFSNCTACASEKEIFVVESVAEQLKEHLKKYGAYEISGDQGKELLKHIFKEIKGPAEPGVINMDYIGKTPTFILKSIGLEVGEDAQIVILETDQNHPLVWTEQIMPVLLGLDGTNHAGFAGGSLCQCGSGHRMGIGRRAKYGPHHGHPFQQHNQHPENGRQSALCFLC